MDHFSLAAGFPQASEAEWLSLVEKALAKAPFDTLRTKLHEGLTTEPLYTQSQSRPPLSGSRGWYVVQPLTASEAQAADDLANGAGALSIGFDADLGVETVSNLKRLLGADVPCIVAPGSAPADAALVLAAKDKSAITGSAGFDPLTAFAVSGERRAQKAALLADAVDAAFHIREHFPAFVPFLASGHAWDGAGGSATEELAFTLAAGVSYWRALAEAGMQLTAAAGCIGFSLTASADIFLTIAKFRALRLLWARALEAAGEKPQDGLMLLARMPERILTAYDSHVNLLRGTAAAFGAAIGGGNRHRDSALRQRQRQPGGFLQAACPQYEPHSARGKLSVRRGRRRRWIGLSRNADERASGIGVGAISPDRSERRPCGGY